MNASNDLSGSRADHLSPSQNFESASVPTHYPAAIAATSYDRLMPTLPNLLHQWAPDLQSTALASVLAQVPDGPELYLIQPTTTPKDHQQTRDDSFRKEGIQPQVLERVGNYADPLEPMRERDLQALKQLFHRNDIYAIEADLNQMLLHLLPEPCWEEDAFDFLQEFL